MFCTTIFISLYFCGFISCVTSLKIHESLFSPNINGNINGFYSQRSPFVTQDLLQQSRTYSQQLQNQQPHTGHQHFYPHQSNVRQLNQQQRNNPFEVLFEWGQLDYAFPTLAQRQKAIASRNFIPENNLPCGVDRWRNRLFISTPRWKTGVPSTLSSIRLPSDDISPLLVPYPSMDWQADMESPYPDCTRLMSVFRIWVDECDRLWVLDAGVVNTTFVITKLCPPKIVVFDLKTDELVISYELQPNKFRADAVYANIIVDVRNGMCSDAYAYIADVSRANIAVFSLAKMRSWITFNRFFYMDPRAASFTLNGLINYQFPTAVLGLSLAPLNQFNDRILYFHPFTSFTEYMVRTSVLRNETLWGVDTLGRSVIHEFVPIGDRGVRGQSSSSGIDRDNVQFYTLAEKNAIGCWNTEKPYTQNAIDIVAQDNTTLIFPVDVKIDRETDQSVWVMSNKFPIFSYSKLNPNEANIRILRASTREAVVGTRCNPDVRTRF